MQPNKRQYSQLDSNIWVIGNNYDHNTVPIRRRPGMMNNQQQNQYIQTMSNNNGPTNQTNAPQPIVENNAPQAPINSMNYEPNNRLDITPLMQLPFQQFQRPAFPQQRPQNNNYRFRNYRNTRPQYRLGQPNAQMGPRMNQMMRPRFPVPNNAFPAPTYGPQQSQPINETPYLDLNNQIQFPSLQDELPTPAQLAIWQNPMPQPVNPLPPPPPNELPIPESQPNLQPNQMNFQNTREVFRPNFNVPRVQQNRNTYNLSNVVSYDTPVFDGYIVETYPYRVIIALDARSTSFDKFQRQWPNHSEFRNITNQSEITRITVSCRALLTKKCLLEYGIRPPFNMVNIKGCKVQFTAEQDLQTGTVYATRFMIDPQSYPEIYESPGIVRKTTKNGVNDANYLVAFTDVHWCKEKTESIPNEVYKRFLEENPSLGTLDEDSMIIALISHAQVPTKRINAGHKTIYVNETFHTVLQIKAFADFEVLHTSDFSAFTDEQKSEFMAKRKKYLTTQLNYDNNFQMSKDVEFSFDNGHVGTQMCRNDIDKHKVSSIESDQSFDPAEKDNVTLTAEGVPSLRFRDCAEASSYIKSLKFIGECENKELTEEERKEYNEHIENIESYTNCNANLQLNATIVKVLPSYIKNGIRFHNYIIKFDNKSLLHKILLSDYITPNTIWKLTSGSAHYQITKDVVILSDDNFYTGDWISKVKSQMVATEIPTAPIALLNPDLEFGDDNIEVYIEHRSPGYLRAVFDGTVPAKPFKRSINPTIIDINKITDEYALDESQKKLLSPFAKPYVPPLMACVSTPGTGKTSTIILLACLLLKRSEMLHLDSKVQIIGISNEQCEDMANKIMQHFQNDESVRPLFVSSDSYTQRVSQFSTADYDNFASDVHPLDIKYKALHSECTDENILLKRAKLKQLCFEINRLRVNQMPENLRANQKLDSQNLSLSSALVKLQQTYSELLQEYADHYKPTLIITTMGNSQNNVTTFEPSDDRKKKRFSDKSEDESSKGKQENLRFNPDFILCDESGRLHLHTIPKITGIMHPTKASSLIFVGDHIGQLTPFTRLQNQAYEILNMSALQYLWERPDILKIQLEYSKRNPPQISDFSTETIYNIGSLNPIIPRKATELPKEFKKLFADNECVTFLDTCTQGGKPNEINSNKQIVNNYETTSIITILKEFKLTESNIIDLITIIIPYQSQKQHFLNRARQALPAGVDLSKLVSTYDSYQGKENDLIIVSTVRCNSIGHCSHDEGKSKDAIGFLADKRRVHMALTRCRKAMIVLGCKKSLSHSKLLKEFISRFEKNSSKSLENIVSY